MKNIKVNENTKPSAVKRAFALFTTLTYLSCLAPAVIYAEPGNNATDKSLPDNPAFFRHFQ